MNPLAVKRAETVHDVNRLGLGLGQHFQAFVQFAVGNGRGGHEVHGRFVALVVRVLDHVQRGRNLVDVGRHADHVQDAVLFRQNVLVIIAALGVGHDGELQVGRVVADDAAQVVLDAVFPAAVFALLDAFARRLVAEFHVIHAGGDAGVIDHLHDFVVEMVVVHQAAVADGAVEDFDFGPVGEPAAGGGVFGFCSFHGC